MCRVPVVSVVMPGQQQKCIDRTQFMYCCGAEGGAGGRGWLGRIKVEPHTPYISVNEHHCIVIIIFIERITGQAGTQSARVEEEEGGEAKGPFVSHRILYRKTESPRTFSYYKL